MSKSTLRLWLRGLIAALITGVSGGASTAVSSLIFDVAHPQDPHLLVKLVIIPTIVGGLVGVFAYLQKSPLPLE